MATSPTQRTLKHCRDQGWLADISEKWQMIPNHPAGGVRKDLFGFIDIVCLQAGSIVAIQCTTGGQVSARCRKIKNECAVSAQAWLAAGGLIEVWGWRKLAQKIDGKQWHPRIVPITLEDFIDDDDFDYNGGTVEVG